MAISEIEEVLRRYRAAISRIGILRAFTRATISALRFTKSILPRPYFAVLFIRGRADASPLYFERVYGGTLATLAPAAPCVEAMVGSGIRCLKPGESFKDCPECPEMVAVPAGEFMLGSPNDEEGRDSAEGPRLKVTIGNPFAVGKFELTFAEWEACVAGGGCTGNKSPKDAMSYGKGRRPVLNVSWDDAKEYVGWLSRKTGKMYRLLSEAEWEYAARGHHDAVLDGQFDLDRSSQLQRSLHLWRQAEAEMPDTAPLPATPTTIL